MTNNYQYYYLVAVKFSRLILTICLTIHYFFLFDIVLRRGSIKTSWLNKGLLVLLFELVIQLAQRAAKQNHNSLPITLCSFRRNRSPAHIYVGHYFGLYVGANNHSIDMEFLLAYALNTRFDFY